jgi:hypothetical protein
MHFFTGAEIKAFLEPSIKEGAAGETWALLDDQFINLLKRLYPRHSLRFTHLAAGLEVYQSVAAQIAEIGILPKDNVRQLREQVERFKTIGAGECPYKTVWKNSLQHHTPNQNKVRNNLYVAFAGQLRSFCATPQAVPQLTAIDDECIRRSLIMSLSECVSSAMTSPLKDPLGGFSGRGDAFTGYTQWVRGGLVGFFGQNSSDQVLKAVRAELMRGGGVSLER